MNQDKRIDFEAALAEERSKGGIPDEGNALGLAFSGGGIRSATFNLGVIQALAKLHLLQRFDYLSTVSGGGYIGSWLSLFIKRYAAGDVAAAEHKLVQPDEHGLEHRAIRFLRAYSNYLTPRVGLSKDTLVAVATYLRNLLLNQTILVALLAALLLVPRVAALCADRLSRWAAFGQWYDAIVIVVLIAPTFTVALCLLYRPQQQVQRPWFMRRWSLVALIDVPVLAAAFVASAFYVRASGSGIEGGAWFGTLLLAYVLLWVVGVALASLCLPTARDTMKQLASRDKAKWHLAFLLFAVIAGAIGAGLFLGVANAIRAVPDEHRLWAGVTLGPPAVLGAIMLTVVAHIGLMGRKFGESDRELWSVFGARLLFLALCWLTLFGVALYGAAAIRWTSDWIVALGGAAWVLSTLFGVLASRGRATGKKKAKSPVELLTRVAPYAFVLGLLLALSWGLHRALEWGQQTGTGVPAASADRAPAPSGDLLLRAPAKPGSPVVTAPAADAPGLWTQFMAIAAAEYKTIEGRFKPFWALPALALAALVAALLLSWRVNINLFSLHHFYRNRLARCYLGATNAERRPHALTGFDPADDVALAELAGQKPLHIVGTAINLNRGRQLAWQNRRAASFSFSPLHAGYEPASAQVSGGYRPVAEYGKDAQGQPMNLATAIAISGAAASPNMGYHTSPAVAFLLTVFNVRLGHWCGDTRDAEAWRKREPALGLRYWLAELTGTADQDYPFVNLSDGGHFENLGIYELVRRRCALILASDAGADPKYAFEDLAEAMRKCYTDFGVVIDFGKGGIEGIRAARRKPSERHYAIAKIVYPGNRPPGTLVYWKASLTADLPPDILNYRRTHGDFPHETTADQFFDESQFESYRHLGFEVAKRSIDTMRADKELPPALA